MKKVLNKIKHKKVLLPCWCSTRPLNFFFVYKFHAQTQGKNLRRVLEKVASFFRVKQNKWKSQCFVSEKKNSNFFFLSQSSKTSNLGVSPNLFLLNFNKKAFVFFPKTSGHRKQLKFVPKFKVFFSLSKNLIIIIFSSFTEVT